MKICQDVKICQDLPRLTEIVKIYWLYSDGLSYVMCNNLCYQAVCHLPTPIKWSQAGEGGNGGGGREEKEEEEEEEKA